MAANAPIVINDGTLPTAVAHTFSGTQVLPNEATYANRAQPFLAGRELLTIRRKSLPKLRICTVLLVVPRVITEDKNGVAVKQVADFMQMEVRFNVPVTWEKPAIDICMPLIANAINHATVKALVGDDEFVW